MCFLTSVLLLLLVAEVVLSRPAVTPRSAVAANIPSASPSNELVASAEPDAMSDLKRQAQDWADDIGGSMLYGSVLEWVRQSRWTEKDKTRCRSLMVRDISTRLSLCTIHPTSASETIQPQALPWDPD